MTNPASLPPGFRFHPTDEELILHYLRNRTASIPCPVEIIAEVDIYKFDPWELPDKALYGDKEWYFFSPRDRKYPNGIRPNRAAGSGYWKATGTDKPIHNSNNNENIGVKKALVFYKGRPPKGMKTSWIMHEYRLAEARSSNSYRPMKFRNTSMRLDDWVLCRIYKKSNQISPIPPLVDHDHDDSSLEENHNYHYPTQSKIPKSCSVSDFLVDCPPMPQFFENLHDVTVTDHNSFFLNPNLNHVFLNGTNNNMVPPVSHMASVGSSLSVVESSLKRHRMNDCNYLEEGEGISNLNPITKKQNISCIDTSYSNPINSLEECFLDHQTLYGNEPLLDPTYSMR